MATYIIPTGKINHAVTVNGNVMTGDTFPVKDIIKTYFGGKWNAQRKGWVIDVSNMNRWMGIKIKPDTSPIAPDKTYSPANWRTPSGELGEDF